MEPRSDDRKNTNSSSSETLRSMDSLDTHFIGILDESLDKIKSDILDKNAGSLSYDSDANMSSGSGGSIGSNDSFHLESPYHHDDRKYRKVSSYQVERSVEKYYYETENNHSTELDILISYMKGQKNIYILSKNYTQYKLNCLLIPSILITAAVTIFAPFIQPFAWSGGFISGLNAITTLLISLSKYLKLESSVDMYAASANQYDKLETSLEFVSSKLLFIDSEAEKSRVILKNIQEVEKKISEIKQWNSLFIPNEVRCIFPIISNINIFSFIKRMEVHRKNLVAKLKDITNELRYITYMQQERERGIKQNVDIEKEESRFSLLTQLKEKTKEDLIQCKLAFGNIDEIFTREIKQAYSYSIFSMSSRVKNTIDMNMSSGPIGKWITEGSSS
jgi:hypothetical protein